MKSRMKSAKIIKMTPAAKNAIDDPDCTGKGHRRFLGRDREDRRDGHHQGANALPSGAR